MTLQTGFFQTKQSIFFAGPSIITWKLIMMHWKFEGKNSIKQKIDQRDFVFFRLSLIGKRLPKL